MINFMWSDGPAGLPAEGLVVRPRGGAERPLGGSGIACDSSPRRAPEAFTAPFQGTGLPFGGAVLDAVAPIAQRPATSLTTDNVHTDSTLGNHSSRRPPS